jgi:hypothetical protein
MYQIEIYRQQYSQPVDMDAVCAAVADLMTDDQFMNDGSLAREHEKVYVQFGAVAEAVERINALGYETDEDVNQEAAFQAEDTKYDEDNWQDFAAEQQAQRDRFNVDA